jgi:hypothetical protein
MSNEVKPAPDTQLDPELAAGEMTGPRGPAEYRVIRPVHLPPINWSLPGALLLTAWMLCVDCFLIWWNCLGASFPTLTVVADVAADYHLLAHGVCIWAVIALSIICLTHPAHLRRSCVLVFIAIVVLHIAGVMLAYWFSGIGVIYDWL